MYRLVRSFVYILMLCGCAIENNFGYAIESIPIMPLLDFKNNDSGQSKALEILFPNNTLILLHQDNEFYHAVKLGEKYIRIFRISPQTPHANKFHILTETWNIDSLCHACRAQIGYASLEKVGSKYEIMIAHRNFDSLGEWGRIDAQNVQFVAMGPGLYGFTYSGKLMHQGVVSYYYSVYELIDEVVPKKILEFYLEGQNLRYAKDLFFKPTKYNLPTYWDLTLETRDNDNHKQTYLWLREGDFYVPQFEDERYHQTWPKIYE